MCLSAVLYAYTRGWAYWQAQGRLVTSHYLHKANFIGPRYGLVRAALQDTPLVEPRLVQSHSHGTAAGIRNTIPVYSLMFALNCGLKPLFYQMSRADQKSGYSGSLSFYWAKEAHLKPSGTRPDESNLVIMNDVDFYVDMADQLLYHPVPHLLSTFAPVAPAGTVADGVFRFIGNTFEMRLSGGGCFKHELYDYGCDQLSVSGWTWTNFFGFQVPTYTYVGYQVEQRRYAEQRAIVVLNPTVGYRGLAAVMAEGILSSGSLKRLSPLKDGYNVINTLVSGKPATTSVSSDGSWTAATLPMATDAVLRDVAGTVRERKIGMQMATVESYLDKEGDRKADAAILTPYYAKVSGINMGPFVYPVEYSVEPYQFTSHYSPGLKSTLKPFGAAIIAPTPAPDACKDNDERTVKKRIEHAKTPHLSVNRFLANAINDFAEYLVPPDQQHTLIPTDVEEVFEKQNRPTQRRILETASVTGIFYRNIAKCFQKKEAYAKFGDPRNITTIPGPEKLSYSRFIYALSKLLKKMPWYAFGKSPEEVARRVASICGISSKTFLGDFSRMDGHVANVGRLLMRAIMLRAFKPEYHDELLRLMATQHHKRAVTTFGVMFETLFSRLSGSPETSAFNTIESAFIGYLALRMTIKEGGDYYTHKEAIDLMNLKGFYGGDDSLVGDMDMASYAKAAKQLGHIVTGEVVNRGERGVNFLARYYSPQVWTGRLDSCTDIARAASKFFTAANLPDTVTPEQKLVEKSLSILATDPNTPILGDIARKAVSFGKDAGGSSGDTSWWVLNGATDMFPNDNTDGWMDFELAQQLPTFDYPAFVRNVNACKSRKDLLALPCVETDPSPPRQTKEVFTRDGQGEAEEPMGASEMESQGVVAHLPICVEPALDVTGHSVADAISVYEAFAFLTGMWNAAEEHRTDLLPPAKAGPPRRKKKRRRAGRGGE